MYKLFFKSQKTVKSVLFAIYLREGMVIRMFEYDFSIALELAEKNNGIFEIEFPQSCVLKDAFRARPRDEELNESKQFKI